MREQKGLYKYTTKIDVKKILSLIGEIVFVLAILSLAYLFDPYYPLVVIATFVAIKLILNKL